MSQHLLATIEPHLRPYLQTIAKETTGKCDVCGCEPTFQSKTGRKLCAACFTLTAKMPRPNGQKDSQIFATGGFMGLLLTPEQMTVYFPANDEKKVWDFMAHLTVRHTPRYFQQGNPLSFLSTSLEDVLALSNNTSYFWGILAGSDAYAILSEMIDQPWSIRQNRLEFYRYGPGQAPFLDTEEGFLALRDTDQHEGAWKAVKDLKRILQEQDEKKLQKKMEKFTSETKSEHIAIVKRLHEHAMYYFFNKENAHA